MSMNIVFNFFCSADWICKYTGSRCFVTVYTLSRVPSRDSRHITSCKRVTIRIRVGVHDKIKEKLATTDTCTEKRD